MATFGGTLLIADVVEALFGTRASDVRPMFARLALRNPNITGIAGLLRASPHADMRPAGRFRAV